MNMESEGMGGKKYFINFVDVFLGWSTSAQMAVSRE